MTFSKVNQTRVEKMMEVLKSYGYSRDRWGHMKLTENGESYRYKFQKTSFRGEIKVGSSWKKVAGGYYKDFEVRNNKIRRVSHEKATTTSAK